MRARFVAAVAAGLVASSCGVHVHAAEVPAVRSTEVVVVAQYLDDNDDFRQDLVERVGDGTVYVYDRTANAYVPTEHEFTGNGGWWTEEQDWCDDSFVGDVYEAVVYTFGTTTEDDDEIICGRYVGYVEYDARSGSAGQASLEVQCDELDLHR